MHFAHFELMLYLCSVAILALVFVLQVEMFSCL